MDYASKWIDSDLEVALVRQRLYRSTLDDPRKAIQAAFDKIDLHSAVGPGKTVAVAVGSRGIDHIDMVVSLCVQHLRSIGLAPYIVPAMGSHGGATAEGQRAVLAQLGITESTISAPIHASMTVDCVGKLTNGVQLYMAKEATAADYVVLINRIKPHTKFNADIESGLCKMLTIGLGKARGAAEFHRAAVHHSFGIIEDAARKLMAARRLLYGLALTEDGYGHLAHVEVVLPSDLVSREKQLLMQVKKTMGRIPFDDIELLIIDQMGKDISGIGMDSNVTGRHRDLVGDFHTAPHVKRIFVRDLSPASDGNANGVGLADFTTRRLVERIDFSKTYANAITAISPEKAAVPMQFDTDRDAIAAALQTIAVRQAEQVRLVRISNTAQLDWLYASKAYSAEIESNPAIEQISPFLPLEFDEAGNLASWRRHG